MNDELMMAMWKCNQKRAVVTFKSGMELKGFVDTFESRDDNDGEASICFEGNNGAMLIIDESDLDAIRPDEQDDEA